MHAGGPVWDAHCTQGGLISVAANTPHLFDGGETPLFTALRVFTQPDGWVLLNTGDSVIERIVGSSAARS